MSNDIQNDLAKLDWAIDWNRRGMSKNEGGITRAARQLLTSLEKSGMSLDQFQKEYGGGKHHTPFDWILTKLKAAQTKHKESTALQKSEQGDIWQAFEPFLQELDNMIRKHMTEYLRDAQKKIGKNGSIREYARKHSEKGKSHLHPYMQIWQQIDSIKKHDEKTKLPPYKDIKKLGISVDQYLDQHRAIMSRQDTSEPLYTQALEKMIAEQLQMNRINLKKAILKKIDPLNFQKAEKLQVSQGAKGFEGTFLLTMKNGETLRLKTIAGGAGGYNIQSFHYRYLVHLLK